MDISDVLGYGPARPQHLDLDRLSSVLLGLDGATESRRTQSGADQVPFELSKHIDPQCATYAAVQRAMRLCSVQTREDALAQWSQIAALAAVWLDGLMTGMRFIEDGGRREPIRPYVPQP